MGRSARSCCWLWSTEGRTKNGRHSESADDAANDVVILGLDGGGVLAHGGGLGKGGLGVGGGADLGGVRTRHEAAGKGHDPVGAHKPTEGEAVPPPRVQQIDGSRRERRILRAMQRRLADDKVAVHALGERGLRLGGRLGRGVWRGRGGGHGAGAGAGDGGGGGGGGGGGREQHAARAHAHQPADARGGPARLARPLGQGRCGPAITRHRHAGARGHVMPGGAGGMPGRLLGVGWDAIGGARGMRVGGVYTSTGRAARRRAREGAWRRQRAPDGGGRARPTERAAATGRTSGLHTDKPAQTLRGPTGA